jgi:hypothetical protein
MRATRKWGGRATTVAALATAGILTLGGIAQADIIQGTIVDGGTSITLVAGSATSGSATIRVVGTGGDGDANCNWDAGEAALVLDIVTPAGITANHDPLSITSCGDNFPVSFTASSEAKSGHVTVAVQSSPAGGGTYVSQVDIPITVTQPAPTNTKPSVAVTGVADGASYEIGSVPAAGCAVTDAEDGNSTAPAVLTGTLSYGLGSQTATCDATDTGGLAADTASVTYTIVDTGNPTISHSLSPAVPNGANGWYTSEVKVDFTCDDSGSGIASCEGDTTLTEGADQSVTGTATDYAGNTATNTVSGINIDTTNPTVSLVGGPAANSSYYFGNDQAAPTCTASDETSGLVAPCTVTGGGTGVGQHTWTATATDRAGNTSTATLDYTVLAWDLRGFYSPVDMGGVWNTVKGGSTVPLKFEAFAGSELTSTSAVKSFTQKQVTCVSGALIDEIEITSTGGTALRYDSTAGQFIQNWATPKKPGTCWAVTMTTQDGSSVSANFLLK